MLKRQRPLNEHVSKDISKKTGMSGCVPDINEHADNKNIKSYATIVFSTKSGIFKRAYLQSRYRKQNVTKEFTLGTQRAQLEHLT